MTWLISIAIMHKAHSFNLAQIKCRQFGGTDFTLTVKIQLSLDKKNYYNGKHTTQSYEIAYTCYYTTENKRKLQCGLFHNITHTKYCF
jgi:hypothetical protein